MTRVFVLVASLALPTIAVWPLVVQLTPFAERSGLARLGRLATATLAGLGLASLVSFFWLLAGGALGLGYVVADALLFTTVAVGSWTAWYRLKIAGSVSATATSVVESLSPQKVIDRKNFTRVALALFGLAIAVALWRFTQATAARPHGGWDAWAIWNHRARFILRAGYEWRRAFVSDVAWSHPEYPLFIPLSVARLWAYTGETTLVPAVLSAVFTFAAPVSLAGAVGAAAGPVTGAVAGLLLLGTPGFVIQGASQFADMPVAALLVAGFSILLGGKRSDERRRARTLVLGGFFLGLAGWTKNEGLAAATVATVVWTFLTYRELGSVAALRQLSLLMAGALLPAMAWFAFHVAILSSLMPEFAVHSRTALGERLQDGGRWWFVLRETTSRFPGVQLGLPAVCIALAFLLGARLRGLLRSPAVLVAALLYVIYVGVFVVTPYPVAWHIDTTAARLGLQPWPTFLLGLFAAAAPGPPKTR